MLYQVFSLLGLLLLVGISLFLLYVAVRLTRSRVAAKISLRNLTRQFRRNLLLGIGIALGMCILVMTTSFTNGLTDILFNRLMVYMTGHIAVEARESTSVNTSVIRDTPRVIKAIRDNVPGVTQIRENVATFSRGIGNGKSGFFMLVGIPPGSRFAADLNMEAGNADDVFRKDVYPGLVLYKTAARDLNVGLNDIVKMKFETVYKQAQFANFKIVGIIRSENLFMDVAAFVDGEELRTLMNLKPEECLGLTVITDHPEDARRLISEADALFASLEPRAAGVRAGLTAGARETDADVFALKIATSASAKSLAATGLVFTAGSLEELAADEKGVVLSENAAAALGVGPGAKVRYSYTPSYAPDRVERELVVTGIVKTPDGFRDATALVHEALFYDTFFWNLPQVPAKVGQDAPLFNALLPEWELLPRTADSMAYLKKYQALTKSDWAGTRMDVSTMFETGSMIVDLQAGLNAVSVTAVAILFVVIVIGVVNTMRMSIRDRTREIGTVRAIGMQKHDVKSVFVFEILFLGLAACVVGALIGFGLMALIGSVSFDLGDNPFSMFFVDRHLHFVPTAASVYVIFGVILMMTYFIAFMTARRAAKMRAADALRHYE